MKILYINACVRENSRTKILASRYLQGITGEITEIQLDNTILLPLNGERLESRDGLLASGQLNDPFFALARQFAEADEIVIATPFWDLGFPALLKTYLENVTVSGITFRYDNGKPVGLCKAKKLTYITTAGGSIVTDFGYAYVKALATNFYGIPDVVSYRVENVDVKGVVGEDILKETLIAIK